LILLKSLFVHVSFNPQLGPPQVIFLLFDLIFRVATMFRCPLPGIPSPGLEQLEKLLLVRTFILERSFSQRNLQELVRHKHYIILQFYKGLPKLFFIDFLLLHILNINGLDKTLIIDRF
jgi:hypothetical protein